MIKGSVLINIHIVALGQIRLLLSQVTVDGPLCRFSSRRFPSPNPNPNPIPDSNPKP